MTVTRKVLKALVDAGAPITAADLAQRLGLGRDAITSVLGRLKRSKRISCHKEAGARARYYLTSAQVTLFKAGKTRRDARPARPPVSPLKEIASPADLSRRLRFLTELSQRPAFLGNALLSEVVNDYRLALKRTVTKEDKPA